MRSPLSRSFRTWIAWLLLAMLVAGLVVLALVALVKPSWLPGLNGMSQMQEIA